MDPKITEGIIWFAVFLFSTTLHEAAHAFTAMKLGDRTAYEGGQVTLDPIPHIRREPFGMIVVPIISYVFSGWMLGWASAPYNVQWAHQHPKRSAIMAAAGPASNLLLTLLAALVIRLGISGGVFSAPDLLTFSHIVDAAPGGLWPIIGNLASIAFSLNLLLFIFNILPLPPLDGSAMIPILLNDEQNARYMNLIRNPAWAFIGFFIAWQLFGYVYQPIQLFAVNLLFPGMHYS